SHPWAQIHILEIVPEGQSERTVCRTCPTHRWVEYRGKLDMHPARGRISRGLSTDRERLQPEIDTQFVLGANVVKRLRQVRELVGRGIVVSGCAIQPLRPLPGFSVPARIGEVESHSDVGSDLSGLAVNLVVDIVSGPIPGVVKRFVCCVTDREWFVAM